MVFFNLCYFMYNSCVCKMVKRVLMLAENYQTLTLSDAMFTVVSMKGPMFLKITETLLCFFGGENVCTCMILRFCPTDFEL